MGTLGLPLSLNRYSYVANNPTLTADPSGLAPTGPPNDQPSSGAYEFGSPGKSRALTDNACFSSANNVILGELVNGACTEFIRMVNEEIQVTVNGVTYTVPVLFAAGTPPSGGSGGGGSEEDQIVHARGPYTTNRSRIVQVLGLTKQQFNKAIHALKLDVPGNPDMVFDTRNGDVYDRRSGEYVGNLLDELR